MQSSGPQGQVHSRTEIYGILRDGKWGRGNPAVVWCMPALNVVLGKCDAGASFDSGVGHSEG
jgi:hypothetical protein